MAAGWCVSHGLKGLASLQQGDGDQGGHGGAHGVKNHQDALREQKLCRAEKEAQAGDNTSVSHPKSFQQLETEHQAEQADSGAASNQAAVGKDQDRDQYQCERHAHC